MKDTMVYIYRCLRLDFNAVLAENFSCYNWTGSNWILNKCYAINSQDGRELDEDELSLCSESNYSADTVETTSQNVESLEDNLDDLYLGTTTRHQWQVLFLQWEQLLVIYSECFFNLFFCLQSTYSDRNFFYYNMVSILFKNRKRCVREVAVTWI